jgi:hypothetical protein
MFTLILILIGISTYAQEGIGKFKINSSKIDIIKDVEKELGTLYEITNVIEFYTNHYVGGGLKFQEILLDTNCRNTKIFYLSEYTISNIKLKEVYLAFYNDILIEFRCNKNKELDILFSKKYGRPYVFDKVNPDVHSNTLKYDEHTTKFVWREGNITTVSFEKKQLFDGITRDAGSYFIIYEVMYKKIIEECDIFKNENIKID